MGKCRICGVSNTIVAENSALSTKLDEAELRIADLEQVLTGDVTSPEQIQFYRPYARRVNLPPNSIEITHTIEISQAKEQEHEKAER